MNKYVVIPVEELLKDVNKCFAGFKIHDKVPTNLNYSIFVTLDKKQS